MSEATAIIHLYRLEVRDANAVSGPFSYGFPAPTAFIGFAHALQRRLGDIRLGGVGIVCHGAEPQIYRPRGQHVSLFRLRRFPYIAGWKKFKNEPAAIIEEGRVHFTVSLLIEVMDELLEYEREELAARIRAELMTMRLAGGTLLPKPYRVEVQSWGETEEEQRAAFRKWRYRLLPGFALVDRSELLARRLDELRREDPDASALDAFLDLLALHVEPEIDPETGAVTWQARRREPGWLVPLPVAYAALQSYPPGQVKNVRDRNTPFAFVETLYGLGEWRGPHRIDRLDHMLWHHRHQEETGLYFAHNPYTNPKEKPHGQER